MQQERGMPVEAKSSLAIFHLKPAIQMITQLKFIYYSIALCFCI
jgi:hypothetical protein